MNQLVSIKNEARTKRKKFTLCHQQEQPYAGECAPLQCKQLMQINCTSMLNPSVAPLVKKILKLPPICTWACEMPEIHG